MLRTHLVLPLVTSLSLLAFAPPAEAGPPWTRGHGHDYRAGDCKYEFKSGPHGYKEECNCEGGRKLAGGPPPWAPAHGWRRKHEGYVLCVQAVPGGGDGGSWVMAWSGFLVTGLTGSRSRPLTGSTRDPGRAAAAPLLRQ